MEAGDAGLATNVDWNFLSDDGPFSNPNDRAGNIGDGLGFSFSNGYADPDFANIADQLANENFFDAAEVLGGKQNIYDIKFAANPDLDRSGLHHEARIPRTDSMSPKSEDDRMSVNGYFQRRSAYSCNHDHPDGNYLSCLSRADKEEVDFDGNVVEERRSTLTRNDLFHIINSNDANKVRKQKGPSSVCSSTSTSRSSSIGTVAALAELDRILHDVSSDDESLRPSIIPPKMTRSEPVFSTKPTNEVPLDRAVRFDAVAAANNKSPKAVAKQRPNFVTSTAIKDNSPSLNTLAKEKPRQPSVPDGNDTLFLGNKTEEILRRANNVLERIGRMKDGIKESDDNEIRRASSHQPAHFQQRPSMPRNSSRVDAEQFQSQPRSEPLSHAQPRGRPEVPKKSIEVQTDSEQGSMYHDVSSGYQHSTLLEQTTYPVPRSTDLKRDLCVATHRIFFPPTEVGESSTAKLQIKNYTSQVYQLQFSFLSPTNVFQNRYDNLNIQPRRYLNLPLRFVPTQTGYWETKVRIVGRPSDVVLIVDLVGEGIMGLKQH